MPTKRIFDLVVITGLLLRPAWGVVQMASRRWQREETGVQNSLGDVIQVLG